MSKTIKPTNTPSAHPHHPAHAITRRRAIGNTLAGTLMGSVIAAGLTAASPAYADVAAEEFMAKIIEEANEIFSLQSEAEQRAGVQRLVDRYVDMRWVSRFALGQYARVITDEQKAKYEPLFKRYATSVYQNALSQYSGEKLVVTNSVERSPRDFVVNSKIINAPAGSGLADLIVHWRVYRAKDGKLAVIDAGAENIWLAIEQQGQFKSVIANNGGGTKGIDALIKDLESRVAA